MTPEIVQCAAGAHGALSGIGSESGVRFVGIGYVGEASY
jgi:hypothetical protein